MGETNVDDNVEDKERNVGHKFQTNITLPIFVKFGDTADSHDLLAVAIVSLGTYRRTHKIKVKQMTMQ